MIHLHSYITHDSFLLSKLLHRWVIPASHAKNSTVLVTPIFTAPSCFYLAFIYSFN